LKILSLSSIRSDYDLLSDIYKKLSLSESLDFGLIVAGSHVANFHGDTLNFIRSDGVKIISEIDSFVELDSLGSQVLSSSKLLNELYNVFFDFKPNLVLVVGDREDALMLAIASTYFKIPMIHFFGGDQTIGGHVDNQVRHAISKLSSLHFVVHEKHFQRLVKLGEDPERIAIIGNPSLDNFVNEEFIEKSKLFKSIFGNKLDNNSKICLFIYHPFEENLENFYSALTFLVDYISNFGMYLIIGRSNNDPGYLKIEEVYRKLKNNPNIIFIDSLKRELFINLLRNSELLVGNSSLGILEAATLNLPVINIGKRQLGRLSGKNVVHSSLNIDELKFAVDKILSKEFKDSIAGLKNIYGSGNSSQKVIDLIHDIDLNKFVRKTYDPLQFD
jgi:UDP-hydrolysing UDP-N-acetyl-D-glucosamine 2-epimerase